MIMKIFADNLQALRKEHNLTQDELARMSHIERKTIIHYETLQRSARLDTIEAIASALNVSVPSLLTEKR